MNKSLKVIEEDDRREKEIGEQDFEREEKE